MDVAEDVRTSLARQFANGAFLEIQPTLEAVTKYYSIVTPSRFVRAVELVTGPLNQQLLHQHQVHFQQWVLHKIQTCLESIQELYEDDVAILIPILAFETNRYGSILFDRYLPILNSALHNPSFAIYLANQAYDAPEEVLPLQIKKHIIEAMISILTTTGFHRDTRNDAQFSPTHSPSSSHQQRGTELSRPVPKLKGEDLARFFQHCFDLALHASVRLVLWCIDRALPLTTFPEFIRLHIPLLIHLLPLLPQHGVPYTDFVLQHVYRGALYAILHQGVEAEPPPNAVGHAGWRQRLEAAQMAFARFDHDALRQVLGSQYDALVEMRGVRSR